MKHSTKNENNQNVYLKTKCERFANILISSEKIGMILTISWRGRMMNILIEKNGKKSVQLKNFPNYYIDCKATEIFSFNSKGEKLFLKPIPKRAVKTYLLYKNGLGHEVTFWQIIKENLPEIEANFL